MRARSICSGVLISVLMIAGIVQAGLFSPPLKNPSFESPSLGAGHSGRWSASIDNWIINVSGSIYLEDGSWFPTPDGINVPKIWDGGYLWQQIGTWDQNIDYVITMWVGRSDASSALQVDLYAGGNPSLLPASGYGTIDGTVGATAITNATVVLTPTVAVGSSQRMSVTLNTGTGRNTGDALWLRIQSNSASGTASYVDDVIVALAVDPALASAPRPADKATDVPRNVILSWKPGSFANKHAVCFGAGSDDVSAATAAAPRGVLVSRGQDANSFDVGCLALGQTYYWRIDEVNAAPDNTVRKGIVWSFTVEPIAYAITNITATASSSDAGKGPENTINGSGLTDDLHGTDTKTMWISSKTGPKPVWIQYTFDRVYKLYELWVWNYNSEFESVLGFGLKDVTIQYSTNGTDWTAFGDFELAQGPGTDGYAHNTVVNLGGVAAKQVKIVMNSGWSAVNQYGLSEVRFFYVPVSAREPKPVTGSTNVDPDVTLSWRAGREAASHNVYISDDANAVANGTAPLATVTNASYTPTGLQLGTTYYWKVNEVNAAEAISTWAGDVWSFATPTYITIDDFESYNDTVGTRIFDTWIDGWNTTTNGAVVGYGTSPFAERTIVHGGSQSMPFAYNNGGYALSEATCTITGNGNWTRAGIKTLVLFFRGTAGNAAGQLYVKINGTKVTYPGDAAIFAASVWKQWNIDLASVSGVNVKSVTTLTIGVSGSGKGTLYFDDIRLYKSAPAVAQPTDPGTANLMAYYALDGDARDTKGGYNGTLNNVTFANSMTGSGQAAVFNGTTSYIDLGATFGSGLISKLTNSTFAVWVNYTGSGAVWQRVFDFGSSTTAYMFMTTRNGSSYPRFAIMGSGKAEVNATAGRSMSVGWHHLTGVIDASAMTIALYVDGSLAQGGVATTVLPKDMGATTNSWIGRSQFTADPYLNGSVDDLRIYNRVLSAGEISYLAGDR